MIRVRVERNASGDPVRVLVTGHAESAEHGKDLVCAAVTGITIGFVNSMEQLTGVQVHQPDDGEGHVDCRIPDTTTGKIREQLTLLLEAMIISLKMYADELPAYIRFTNKSQI